MSNSYIPLRDVDLVPWADNFRDLIVANPTLYGLVAGDGTAIATLVDAYDAAYATAVNPSTRTPPTIAGKDSAKGAMIPILRLYAQTIKLNQGVSNENKVALGIHIDDAGPTPIPVPTAVPSIALTAQRHLSMTFDVRNAATPLSRAKPFGAAGMLFFVKFSAIADPTPTDPELAEFRGVGTRNLETFDFVDAEVTKRATFWSKYYNAKGEIGPWSASFSQVVA